MFKDLRKKFLDYPYIDKEMKQYYFFSIAFFRRFFLKKYQVEKSYNYYKRQYRNYLLLVKRKNKYITYKVGL